MDERLPLGSLDAPALRMLLDRERRQREELAQEVARLRAGLARQNERILVLERDNTALREVVVTQQQLIAWLQEQNALLREQVAQLQAENTHLAGTSRESKRAPGEWPNARTKQEGAGKTRTKREGQHNRGRQRLPPDPEVRHAAERCPRCGRELSGGWEHRRVEVIELPPPVPVVVTDHVLVPRQCPGCGTRVPPTLPTGVAGRVDRCRLGPRLLAQLATMAIVERLLVREIQRRLLHTFQFGLSLGGITGALEQVARQSAPAYAQLQQDIRGSPVVHADETGWRENGQQRTVWTVSTTQTVYVQHGRRTNAEIDGILGADFGGTIVADCYAAYDVRPVLPKRASARMFVGRASSGSPTMTTISSTVGAMPTPSW